MRKWIITAAALVAAGGLAAVAVQAQAPPPPPPRPGSPPAPQTNARPRIDVRRFIETYDRNRDGFLDPSEVPLDLREMFDRIDTNRDGRLSQAELEQFFAKNPPQQPPQVPLPEIVNEWVVGAASDARALQELQQAYDLLRRLDANNDGRISAAEVRAIQPRLIERRVDAIFRDLDTNRDGRISRQEAKGSLAQDFDRLDLNRDGFLDRQELIRALTLPPPTATPAAPGTPPPPPTGRPAPPPPAR